MSKVSWLLVYEHLSSGSNAAWPDGMATEGVAMLSAFLADCAAWGQVRTSIILDRRLAGLKLPAHETILVEPGEGETALSTTLARCDAAFIIAPETGGVLARLSRQVLAAGVRLIGSSPAAVELAGDKWACCQRWRAAGVPTPLTRLAPAGDVRPVADALGYPLMVKPADGAGCAGVSLVHTPEVLEPALRLATDGTAQQPILLQRYVAGKDASVALLVARDEIMPLSLNGQEIVLGQPLSYHGGIVPLTHPAAEQALAVARAAVAALPELRGYVGVDLVLAGTTAWAIEVNPRLTTAYVGLRHIARVNLAQAIWQACVEDRLPDTVPLHGRAIFSKDGKVHLEEVP